MAQQTAVDWLVKEFSLEDFKATIYFAKAMEKEQIIDSFVEGISVPYMDVIGERRLFVLPKDETMCAEQYYKETYNK